METMVRNHLVEMISGNAAHVPFERAVEGFPFALANRKVEGLEHSMWMLVEHLRIVNRDLLDWVTSADYRKIPFPSGYWPAEGVHREEDWLASLSLVREEMDEMKEWAENEGFPIFEPLAKKTNHSAGREVILALIHNGYHIGQMVDLRALLGVPVKDW